jgi:hypothetical protein
MPVVGIHNLAFNGLDLIAAVVLALLEGLNLRINISTALLLDSEFVLALRDCLLCQFLHLALILMYLSLSSSDLPEDITFEIPKSLRCLNNPVSLNALLIDFIFQFPYLLL